MDMSASYKTNTAARMGIKVLVHAGLQISSSKLGSFYEIQSTYKLMLCDFHR